MCSTMRALVPLLSLFLLGGQAQHGSDWTYSGPRIGAHEEDGSFWLMQEVRQTFASCRVFPSSAAQGPFLQGGRDAR
ncbi:hypothetical protein P7K49_015381 [Saguinus oedipus]|uniref:Uncharacterized protein n=1 Tax=Saguinus oedipus TaxID=9490 RepID=A0ABQ9V9I6_SAGOE|nr:hypothetical protein P7K49_015381 [Saguinus oedipus]